MNNLDAFFKNKLSSHRVAPAPEAWLKLEKKLKKDKNNKAAIWTSITASILLFVSSLVYISNDSSTNNQNIIAEIHPVEEKTIPTEEMTKTTSIHLSEKSIPRNPINNIEMHEKLKDTKSDIEIHKPNNITPSSVNDSISFNKEKSGEVAKNESLLNSSNQTITQLETETDIPKKSPASIHSSITIVYNLEPAVKIDSSVLKEAPKGNNEKSNMLGKIVAFAKNAKTSEVGLGQIRAAKDDFLSLENLKNYGKKQVQK